MPDAIEVEAAVAVEIIETLAQMEIRLIQDAMIRRNKNQTLAARDLGISQKTLSRKLKYIPLADRLAVSSGAQRTILVR